MRGTTVRVYLESLIVTVHEATASICAHELIRKPSGPVRYLRPWILSLNRASGAAALRPLRSKAAQASRSGGAAVSSTLTLSYARVAPMLGCSVPLVNTMWKSLGIDGRTSAAGTLLRHLEKFPALLTVTC